MRIGQARGDYSPGFALCLQLFVAYGYLEPELVLAKPRALRTSNRQKGTFMCIMSNTKCVYERLLNVHFEPVATSKNNEYKCFFKKINMQPVHPFLSAFECSIYSQVSALRNTIKVWIVLDHNGTSAK